MKIDKGIEMPEARINSCKYPFRKMEIGDSFLHEKPYSRENMSLISNNARNFCSQSKDCKHYKFSARKVDDGIRVWRIK